MKLFGRKRKSSRGLPNYWNESVIRIQRDVGVDRETARTWFNEMLVFLDMVADSKEFISPPEAIDVAWHACILHTRDYDDHRRERFGRVIDHKPTGAPDPDAYRRAYHQRSATGSPVDNSVWVIPAAAAGGVAATEGVAAAEGGHDVGPAVQDTGPGDGGGGGFFSNLFGGDAGAGGSGDSCGGGGCGGGGG
jgi:hypothetical protein